jgi:hypothetical protein
MPHTSTLSAPALAAISDESGHPDVMSNTDKRTDASARPATAPNMCVSAAFSVTLRLSLFNFAMMSSLT